MNAPRAEIRTAECDCFCAESTVVIARTDEGIVKAAIALIMPAEIMAARIGPWTFVGWPAEMYVEFGSGRESSLSQLLSD